MCSLSKEQIRQGIILERRNLTNRLDKQAAIRRNFALVANSLNLRARQTIFGAYVAFNGEVDVQSIVDDILDICTVACLSTINDSGMYFKLVMHGWRSQLEHCSKHGMLQPITHLCNVIPNIVITPLVAFDNKGYRIGYGGGYYDRFFAQHKCLKIGVAFDVQRIARAPYKDHDVPLDLIITESGIVSKKELTG